MKAPVGVLIQSVAWDKEGNLTLSLMMFGGNYSVKGTGKVSDPFGLIKNLIAESSEDWKLANQVRVMDYAAFAKRYTLKVVDGLLTGDLSRNHATVPLVTLLERLDNHRKTSEGIINLVQYMKVIDEEEVNNITRFVNKMFDPSLTFDAFAQGASNYTGNAWGAEFNLRVSHTLGNWFVQGYIEQAHIRIFKKDSGITVFSSMDGDWVEQPDKSFGVNDKEGFFEFMKEQCVARAPRR